MYKEDLIKLVLDKKAVIYVESKYSDIFKFQALLQYIFPERRISNICYKYYFQRNDSYGCEDSVPESKGYYKTVLNIEEFFDITFDINLFPI